MRFFFLITFLLLSLDRFVHLHYILTVTLPQRLFKIIQELIDAIGLFRRPMGCDFQCFHCGFTFFGRAVLQPVPGPLSCDRIPLQ
jgi:hypothetical protein